MVPKTSLFVFGVVLPSVKLNEIFGMGMERMEGGREGAMERGREGEGEGGREGGWEGVREGEREGERKEVSPGKKDGRKREG